MPLTRERKQEIIKQYGKSDKDSGNSDVQVALLTDQINMLTEHLKAHPNDHHTRYGLLKKVGQRRSLLDYLSQVDINRYRELIKTLNIRK